MERESPMHNNEVYISAKNQKSQLKKVKSLEFGYNPTAEWKAFNIYPDLKYQRIYGFGGAFTGSSAANYVQMSENTKREFLKLVFDKKNGLGYNFCRSTINSCDFSENEYTYVDDNDTTLESFDISHDKEKIIPMIKAAQKCCKDDLILFASPWSPCGFMKDSGKMIEGGKLKKEMYSAWAQYYVKYINEYKKCGIKISAVTVQNEPMATQTWESCVYTPKEQIEFVRDYLYPALKEEGLSDDVKIMIWDHNKEHVYDWARELKATENATECVWGIAFHWYSGDHFDGLKFAKELLPEIRLISSEFCFGGVTPDWNDAEHYAYDMTENFNNYMNASTDWNIVLDEKGGPYHARNGGCKAVIHYNTKKDSLTVMPHYYAVAHFSKYVERGAVRLGTTKYCQSVNIAAFENPNGDIVAVITGRNDEKESCYLRINDYAAKFEIEPHSIMTVVIKKDEF